jgi:hypothetical protein
MPGLRIAIVALAVIVAVPFGWELGVFIAQLIVGRDVGVFPVLTIPMGLVVAIAFALRSTVNPGFRLAALAVGTGALALIL